jgi:DNA-binding transcriptional ArsR family regulator
MARCDTVWTVVGRLLIRKVAGSSPARGANLQVSALSTWPCLLCGNPLAPTGCLERHPSVPGSQAPSSAWPPWGSGAAAPSGALRAIDPSAQPRFGPAFGRRRLRRQSEPALVATQGGATGVARRGQQPERDVHGDAHRLTRFRNRKVGATTDTPSTGVARRATHALRSAPCSRPLRDAELTGSMSLHMVSHMPKYVSLDRTFRALADPTRRSILQLVSTGPASISELARPFGIALPTVLEHVRILEETRLLTTEKVGRVRECTLGPERLDEARQWIETFRMWERRLDGLDRYVSTRMGRRA